MRNYSIDTMRFVACFFIIAVHIGGYPQQGELFTEVFRGVSRWAVPFFFLVTGYFLSCQNKRKLLLRLTRITYITLIFSVLFFIFQLTLNYKDGYSSIISIIDPFIFIGGSYFHLWFLPSILIGMISVSYMIENVSENFGISLSILIIFIIWCVDFFGTAYFSHDIYESTRTILSIPTIYIGYYLYTKKDIIIKSNGNLLILCMLSSVVFSVIEILIYKSIYGSLANIRELPLFSVITAIIILMLSIRSQSTKETVLSRIGRDDSIVIYLIHPLFIVLISKVFRVAHEYNGMAILVITFIVSISFSLFVKSKFPSIYLFLTGGFIKETK
ncbi:acyltransferase family protein [Escherichia coli]|nr:acyltransferase family protein [Escherichia coli]EFW7442069.1 hypothetical protein [Shigella sonnei]EHZ3622390.1 acyltransferase family protein [Escherichia coli]EII3486910.1 acyltransferase family protein [Escherichia coli]EKT6091407.1 acyltransferase family protein [Escherichia coli]